MTGFYADGTGMGALAKQIDRITDALNKGKKYVGQYADLGFFSGEGLLLYVVGPHETAYHNMTTELMQFANMTSRISGAITSCEEHYWHVDQQNKQNADYLLRTEDSQVPNIANQQDLDSVKYDHSKGASSLPGAHWSAFRDAAHPGDHYVKPAFVDNSQEWNFNFLSDAPSPSAWMRLFVQKEFHIDIFAEVVNYFSGDWSAYEKAGLVWNALGKAYSDMTANMRRAAADTPSAWKGNAAECCQECLIQVAKCLDEMPGLCKKYAKAYSDATSLAAEASSALTDILADIIDNLAYAALAEGIGALLSETVVGGIAGFGAAAFYIARVGELVYAAYEAMDKFVKAVTKAVALIDGLKLASENLPALPALPTK